MNGDEATPRSDVDAVLMAADGRTGLEPHSIEDDQLIRTSHGWRVAHRRYTTARHGII